MEKVFFVQYDNLKEVNEALAKGGKVKMIHTTGDSYAVYIVVEMPKH
ncbi:hypothetical protein IMSAGC018_00129 [Lachnospiraceae bacterium]|nr:hypothetical protein IMSAGC018_00129 [Lachnospiraceae bacterium]